MPPVTSGKVLVTGANGFIASWVVSDLLQHGFAVRGTVRSVSKATHLRQRFKSYGDQLDLVVVPDIQKDDAFDDFASDVVAILHIASPLVMSIVDPEEVIGPAVRGTTSILHTALKYRTTIKRVVIMSSAAAVHPEYPLPPGTDLTTTQEVDERSWNDYSVELVREKGRDADSFSKYRASKVLAERTAWDLYNGEKDQGRLEWELVVLNSPWVFGPVLSDARSPTMLGATPYEWYRHVVKADLEGYALTKEGYQFVDVRDLARAHVLALTTAEAGGERFLISSADFVWQDIINIARRFSDKIPVGDSTYDPKEAVYPFRYIAVKSVRVLDLKYRTVEETTKDIIDDFRARGWL